MTRVVQTPYSDEQISVWLRGLLTIAWADGHFDPEEQAMIASLTQDELAPKTDLGVLEEISPAQVAEALQPQSVTAENFLRTAVMVSLADGVYSAPEDQILQQFCEVLGQPTDILESLRSTLADQSDAETQPGSSKSFVDHRLTPLQPVQEWLDQLDIHDPRVARFLCRMIPPQCPFERDINLFGHKVVHIPPLCKLNPLYEQLVGLRFRALSYLADDCDEDISEYI